MNEDDFDTFSTDPEDQYYQYDRYGDEEDIDEVVPQERFGYEE